MSNIELRGAAIDAAAESATHHDSGTPPTGICNERDAAGNAAQSAPHHSRTEQEHADSVARSGEPAPAREPVHNDWSKAKAKVLAKYPAAQYEAMQGYLPPYGHIVWINHKRDAPSDRGYGLSNATSEQEAWLEAARNLPAPAREPGAVEEVKRLVDMPTKLLATNVVGSLIKCKGNLNQYGVVIEHLLNEIQKERDEELDRLRAENAALRAKLAAAQKDANVETLNPSNDTESPPSVEDWSVSPDAKNAARWTGLLELAGHFQDGSQTDVLLFQDDATRSCFIRVRKKTYGTDNSSFNSAIDAAIEKERSRG